jgi:signal transduction histidine kinase
VKQTEIDQRVIRDVQKVLVVVFVFTVLSLQLQWSESLSQWIRQYEWLDLDELLLSLGFFFLALLWFIFRRWQDIRSQNQCNEDLQQQKDQLSAQNRNLSMKIMTAQEDERRELARELHDEVAQVCTAIRYDAALIKRDSDFELTHLACDRIEKSATSMHEMTRSMLKRLRPEHLDSLGFEEAVIGLCKRWQEQTSIICDCSVDLISPHLDDYAKTSLYRVIQEALTNIAKHANATRAYVTINLCDDTIHLQVRDNGRGIFQTDLQEVFQLGLGMIGIRERIFSLNGKVDWTRASPGTCIDCYLPLTRGFS